MKKLFIIFSLITILYSCSTDVDLNADYKDITVVYGLLDKNTDCQYIKVNKAFLGDAAVADMASEVDSFTYKSAEVSIKKYRNDDYIKTINFNYTDTIPKDEGFFANEKNVIYVTDETIIEPSEENSLEEYTYELVVKIPNKAEVVSSTKLVSDITILPPLSYKEEVIFYTSYGTTGQYLNTELKFESAKNALLYEIYVEINYYEKEYGLNDYVYKTMIWQQLDKRSISTDGDEEIKSTISGSGFYSYFHNHLSEANVEERVFYSLRFYFVTAGETLTKYIDLTSPDYGIVQEKPSFTNIENGWGLFSSRSSTFSGYKRLESFSLQNLSDGQYTKDDKFLTSSETLIFYLTNISLDFEGLYQ